MSTYTENSLRSFNSTNLRQDEREIVIQIVFQPFLISEKVTTTLSINQFFL